VWDQVSYPKTNNVRVLSWRCVMADRCERSRKKSSHGHVSRGSITSLEREIRIVCLAALSTAVLSEF
jgi:hypothetical protein